VPSFPTFHFLLVVLVLALVMGAVQVVAIADTGLDVKSCFFADAANAVVYSTTTSPVKVCPPYLGPYPGPYLGPYTAPPFPFLPPFLP